MNKLKTYQKFFGLMFFFFPNALWFKYKEFYPPNVIIEVILTKAIDGSSSFVGEYKWF